METKEMLRRERGITLVALIITIIVLIILAAVSINAVLKTDFIGLATNGTINYAEAQVNEQKQMEELDSKLDNVIAKIEKVSSPKPFTGYILYIDNYSKELRIEFLPGECVDFLKSEINRRKNEINKITDEEIFMKLSFPEENKTFAQLVEEEYNAGNIPEKYRTIKEIHIKLNGMTEAEAEAEIAEMRQYYFESMNIDILNIDTNNIDTGNIRIITPGGESLTTWQDTLVPMEVKEHIFQIEYLGETFEMKINIKQYEMVIATEFTNPKLRETMPDVIYALDVKNKEFLTIKSAKVKVGGKEINLESKYFGSQDDCNYLYQNSIMEDSWNGFLTGSKEETTIFKFSLTCNEGVIEGKTVLDKGPV